MDPETKTFTQEDLDAAVSSAITQATDKLSQKNKELLGDLKKAKEASSKYEGIDIEKFQEMTKAFENDQDLKDISEGRINDVIERRLERERADYTSKIDTLSKENDELKENYGKSKATITDLMINTTVTSEFVKQKGIETAIPDVVSRAKSVFQVEGKEVIARDQNGNIITGESGPLTIQEWIANDLQKNAAHLFQGSKGAGTPGGGPEGAGRDKIAELSNAAKTDQAEYQRLRRQQRK